MSSKSFVSLCLLVYTVPVKLVMMKRVSESSIKQVAAVRQLFVNIVPIHMSRQHTPDKWAPDPFLHHALINCLYEI